MEKARVYFDDVKSTEKVAIWLKLKEPILPPPGMRFVDMETADGHKFKGKPALLAPAPHSMGRPYVRLET